MNLSHPPEKPKLSGFMREEPASRYDLIRHQSLFCLFGDEIDTYETVPDRARTDPELGSVEIREAVFLSLASIVESLNGGWPFVLEERISYEFSNLISRFGNTLNVDLVELLILQTLKNENVIFDAAEHREGGSDGNY